MLEVQGSMWTSAVESRVEDGDVCVLQQCRYAVQMGTSAVGEQQSGVSREVGGLLIVGQYSM
jgi:hypothetical protein